MAEFRGAFVAWISYSRRGQLFAKAFGLKMHPIANSRRLPTPVRYCAQWVRTFWRLWRDRPPVVFVQNPPIFAPLAVYLYSALRGATFLIDSHTTALQGPVWRWSFPLHARLSRAAAATLVTNEAHARLVESWGGVALRVPDIPVGLPPGEPLALSGARNVAVIASWAPDEPLGELLRAAKSVPHIRFHITGDASESTLQELAQLPPNVELTGFLPDARYLGLLRGADAVMALTTQENTMQRGGCEALDLGKPLITSDTPLLRSFFSAGTLHVDNTQRGIAQALQVLEVESERLAEEMEGLRARYRAEWSNLRDELETIIRAARGS